MQNIYSAPPPPPLLQRALRLDANMYFCRILHRLTRLHRHILAPTVARLGRFTLTDIFIPLK